MTLLMFTLGLSAVCIAADWGEIIYGGYVSKNQDGTVNADTGVWAFNPNGYLIGCRMQVIDKYGNVLNPNVTLYDGGSPVTSIPKGGHVWITLGMIPEIPMGTNKYTFRLLFSDVPGQPVGGRAPVVEVKEVIYKTPTLPQYGIWEPQNISTWSEAPLGGPVGTGKYKP